MVIRHADPGRDGATCAEIYAPFVRDSAVSFEEETPRADEMAKRIERTSLTHPWLVAEADGRVVGFAYGTRHRERAAYRWAADVTVYVSGEHRRRGIGAALYGELLALLARQGFHVACAGITLPNEASVALHEKCGFSLVGVYRRIGWKLAGWHDVGWWQMELVPAGEQPPREPGPPVRLDEA